MLLRNGKIVGANAVLRIYKALGARFEDIESSLRKCPDTKAECDMQMHEETYMSLPIEDSPLEDGYQLRSLQSLDAVTAPIQLKLRGVFLLAGLGALVGAVLIQRSNVALHSQADHGSDRASAGEREDRRVGGV